MGIRDEVTEFLTRWSDATTARDVERSADLYQRAPRPLVTFSNGERAREWIDVRVRLARDFGRAIVERTEVHHLELEEIGDNAVVASFVYDIHARDVWGMPVVAVRLASMTLVRTKDGLRIAQAHFSAPPF